MAIKILAVRQYVLGKTRLCDHGAGGGTLVFPVGLEDTDGLVVSAETVDSGFDQNEAELGVLVFAVSLEMLADGNSLWGFKIHMSVQTLQWRIHRRIRVCTYLLDQHVKIFWNFGCKTY